MSYFEQAFDAIRAEFLDLGDIRTVAILCFRLLLAAALGGCLGFERQSKGKSAGMRTHMLVALGAAVFVMGPLLAGFDEAGMSRVIQGLVAGVGFLGAGAIVKGKPGEEVEGLTTAASIWMTAAIGTTVGMGRASTAILSTVLSLLVLCVLCGRNGHRGGGRSPEGSASERPTEDAGAA